MRDYWPLGITLPGVTCSVPSPAERVSPVPCAGPRAAAAPGSSGWALGQCEHWEEVVRVDRAAEPVAFDLAPYRVLEFSEDQADALGVQRLIEFGHMSEAVVSTSVTGSAAITIQAGFASARPMVMRRPQGTEPLIILWLGCPPTHRRADQRGAASQVHRPAPRRLGN